MPSRVPAALVLPCAGSEASAWERPAGIRAAEPEPVEAGSGGAPAALAAEPAAEPAAGVAAERVEAMPGTWTQVLKRSRETESMDAPLIDLQVTIVPGAIRAQYKR